MPTNLYGRLTLILAVLLIAFLAIVPPGGWFKSGPLTEKLNLKPGIDMVGGTSLTYEIKPPPGATILSSDLAIQVMESLKKRVDPNGVMNLVWRPQGSRQIEIQMPTSGKAGESQTKRAAYAAAQRDLEATNVRASEVIRAVEKMKGAERDSRLKSLAQGSPTRQKLFAELASTYDQIQAAIAKNDVATQGEKELQYEKLKGQIDDTNLTVATIEMALSQSAAGKPEKLAELKKQFADFPQRLAVIDQFDKAWQGYNEVKTTLDDAADLKRLLQGSGVLEFHILAPLDNPTPEMKAMVERLQKHGPVVQAGDTMRWFQLDKPDELHGQSVSYNDKQWALCYVDPQRSMTKQMNPPWALEEAHQQLENGERKVAFRFDAQGAKYFGDLSGANIGKQLAIILDDKLISAPNLRSRIGASGVIEGGGGGFSEKEVKYLVSTLNAGSLPAQLAEEPISERTVGPQLGEDNLRRGLLACAIGLVVVAVFLIGYYYVAGVVALIAVLMNVLLILGIMAMFNATFTLPGIAGIVLTVGSAVDANVLIFERLREEQQRGLSLRMGMRNAYDRAWSAIVDSNATTVCTSLFLYWLGSEEVKGFGLTLLIGLACSLFTSLFVTKTIFGFMIDKLHINNLSSLPLTFPKWDQALKPNIDWVKLVPYFATISAVFLALGLTAFGVKVSQRQVADIEFASGTSVEFELKKATPIGEVRKLVEDEKFGKVLPSPSVVSIGTNDTEYEIVTPNPDGANVKKAVLAAIGERMKLELPSKFVGVDQPLEDVLDKQVLPIKEDSELVIDGWSPPGVGRYVGGAAIVLKDLNPPLSPEEIRHRMERQRVQVQAGAAGSTYRDYVVVSPNGSAKPTDRAVILTVDPNVPFGSDPLKWQEEVAKPTWQLVNESVAREAQLRRVSNFDAQVAGAARDDAFLALGLSLVGILAYIWFRFGNLKYGTATIVAMLHDALIMLAWIGLAHWMVEYTPWLAKPLMLDPFRINLTIVAAILTVMSYSMMDTIVVFDRVRENRGKFGHVNRRILNDSINQTLSRTLLTGGTNIVTVLVMYIVGGPGIHGFTFILFIGILFGTYSSVAIAAPLLLIGEAKEPVAAGAPKPAAGRLQQA